jgi:hypothetical protein
VKKTKLAALIAGLSLATSGAQADSWTDAEVNKQAAIMGLLTIDALQTLDIKRNPTSAIESNPLLGARPSDRRIVGYFLTTAILHTALADQLSSKHRAMLQDGTIALELLVIGNNYGIGLRVKL